MRSALSSMRPIVQGVQRDFPLKDIYRRESDDRPPQRPPAPPPPPGRRAARAERGARGHAFKETPLSEQNKTKQKTPREEKYIHSIQGTFHRFIGLVFRILPRGNCARVCVCACNRAGSLSAANRSLFSKSQ